MSEKTVSGQAVGAFLSAVALAIREAGGSKERYLIRRINLHLDSLEEKESPLSDLDRENLFVIRAAFEKYLRDPQIARH